MSFEFNGGEAASTAYAVVEEHVATHEEEIRSVLERTSNGEIEMVETISDDAKDLTRQLFGLMAAAGPAVSWSTFGPFLIAALEHLSKVEEVDVWPTWPELPPGVELPSIPPVDPPNPPSYDELGQFVQDHIVELIESYDRHGWVGFSLVLVSYLYYEDFHYPQAETGYYDIAHSTFDKVKWVYRYWFNQLEVAERGSGLEDHFRNQHLLNAVAIPIEETSSDDEVEEEGFEPAAASTRRVTLSAAGDLLAVDALLVGDTSHLFDEITDFFSTADIVSANLESTVDESHDPGRDQPDNNPARMNTSREMFDKFVDEAGVNFFATATNHAMDWDESGIRATLDVLRASGADFSGTAGSAEEQDDVVVVEHNDIKIALLSFTFDLNGFKVPDGKEYLANMVRFNDEDPATDYSLVERQIALAREKGAEFIVAYCHWGWEFEMYPHVNIRAAAHVLVDLGIDVILGNHAHVSQPAEVIRRPGRDDALVTYAFGDFVSYHPESRNSKLAYAVKFEIVRKQVGSRVITSWDHVEALALYIVNAAQGDGGFDCRIVKFDDVLANPDRYGLTQRERNELPHLDQVVWRDILSPLSNTPDSGWSDV